VSDRFIWLGDAAFNTGTTFIGTDDFAQGTLAAGTYYIKISSLVGYHTSRCYTLRTSSSKTNAILEKETEEIATGFEAFPNPANQFLTVTLPTVEAATEGTVRVMDVAGREVIKQTVVLNESANQIQLDVNDFANGMYMIAVQYGTETLVKKIVVNHEK
jgi:hypothetical protein